MTKTIRLWAVALLSLALLGHVGTQTYWKLQGPGPGVVQGEVTEFGVVLYRGPVDVNPTLRRINSGQKLEYRNDGVVFWNRERHLPPQHDPEYYREFVHWDDTLNAKFTGKVLFPGPQRVIIGKRGEIFYTGDHYATWKRIQ